MIPKNLLWKFRSWNNPLHQRAISHREVFFSSFTDNHNADGEEGKVYYSLDVSLEELREAIRQNVIQEGVFEPQNIELEVDIRMARSKLFDPGHFEWLLEYELARNDMFHGILSLATHVANSEIWHSHADEGRGFAVGYSPEVLHQECGADIHPVLYETEIQRRPKLSVREMISLEYEYGRMLEIMNIRYFWKRSHFSWENEYRGIIVSETPLTTEKRRFPVKNALRAVLLGPEMPLSHKYEILRLVQTGNLQCEVFEMFRRDGGFWSKRIMWR